MTDTTVNHQPLVTALLATLERNTQVVRKNTAGISQEDSLLAVAEGSSNLNWLIGHLVSSRDGMLRLLNSETTWDAARGSKYGRGSQLPDPAAVEPLEELLASLDRSHELLAAALTAATAAELAEPSGQRDLSKLEWLGFLGWHDSYHTGQTALYRRLAGLSGTLG
jgi:uncharacterized damage-inducible protein DinB